MSNNAAACPSGGEIGRAQALQAMAAEIEPSVDLNPVLLKPQSNLVAQVVVHGKVVSNLNAKDSLSHRYQLLEPVLESYRKLISAYDFVLVEGAGSAAETNLRKRDIANMGFASHTQIPVCLLADIDRGGVIASVVGTKAVLEESDAALIRSFIINRFRGDVALFEEGKRDIERCTSWPCRGVIPWLESARRLPQEDSVVRAPIGMESQDFGVKKLKIVVPMLSRIANSYDFDPLRLEANVEFDFVPPGTALPRDANVIILPGTKLTLEDLRFLRSQGWDHDIIAHARAGGRVLGLCGGYQLLGRTIRDLDGVEGKPEEALGLGLLDVETDMLNGFCLRSGVQVTGYEIHMGETQGPDTCRRFIRFEHGEDGAICIDGNVAGCYVHGLFSSDEFRTGWLNELRDGTGSDLNYGTAVENSINELADGLENALDIDALLKDANW